VMLPSASTLAVLRGVVAGRSPPPQLVAVLADPVFDLADSRLAAATAGARPGEGSGQPPPAEEGRAPRRPDARTGRAPVATAHGRRDRGIFPRPG